MSKPPFTSRFFAESDSESEEEPKPKPELKPRLTAKQKKKLERQQRFDEEKELQKEAQAAEAKQRQEVNEERRKKKARRQQKEDGHARTSPERFLALSVLGLTPTQDNTVDINRAFRSLALKHHPDKGGDPEKFKPIGVAHAYLLENA
jgi:hypothetical protein